VQNETVGGRCRKDDRLYRARSMLTKAQERLDERGEITQAGLLAAAIHAAKAAPPGTPEGRPSHLRHRRLAPR
jgi:hypothetical protein